MGVLWLLFFQKNHHSFKKRLIQSSIYVISALIIIAPITIRNYIHLNDFVLVTADAGKVFYHGNSRSATVLRRASLPEVEINRGEIDEPDFAHVIFRRYAEKQTGRILRPSEASRFGLSGQFKTLKLSPQDTSNAFSKNSFFSSSTMKHIILLLLTRSTRIPFLFPLSDMA
jgi:hypothetical protein